MNHHRKLVNQRRKGLFWATVLVCIFLVLPFATTKATAAGKKYLVTFGTTTPTSSVYTYYVNLAKILNQEVPEIQVTVRATGASVVNTKLLAKGEVEFGSSTSNTVWLACKGKGAFKDKPYCDARVAWAIRTPPLEFVVSEESGIKDIYGLEGKIFCPGIRGSAAEQIAQNIFKILAIKPNLRYSSYSDAIDAMKDKRIFGIAKFGMRDAGILQVAAVMKIRVLSLSDQDIDKILKNTVALSKTSWPAGIYPGVGEFQTVAIQHMDYARKDVPEEIVYKMVKAVWKHRADIKKAYAPFLADQFPEVTLSSTTCPMHPGAIRWFREMGYTVPKVLIPPELKE